MYLMADATLTVTAVGNPDVSGSKRVWFADITLADNYRTGGVALTEADANLPNLNVIEHVEVLGGVALAADLATGNPVAYDHGSGAFVLFAAGADAGDVLVEKTDDEAVETGQNFRVKIYGH